MDSILEVAQLLKKSNKTVVISGAGISTESGLPDFRSSKGIYQHTPEYVLSHSYFFHHPKEFYDFIRKTMYFRNAKPNQGHLILAEWERRNLVHQIITQNIDGLHDVSQNVMEIHGSILTATCQNKQCRKKYNFYDVLDSGDFHCDCTEDKRYLIKPDIVLYEEAVPLYESAFWSVHDSELLLILGSSLTVQPVASLVTAVIPGTPVVIINNQSTPYEGKKNVIAIHASIGETLAKIDEALNEN